MPIFKRCPKCNRRILEGTTCGCVAKRYKEDDRYRTNSLEREFYSSGDWGKKRTTVIEAFNGIDIYSYYVLGVVEHGETVHHIIPLEDAWDKRLETDNLIYLTERNHRKIHAIMKSGAKNKKEMIEMLQQLLLQYEADFKDA